MGVPDSLSDTSRSQIDLLHAWFFCAEIVAAYREHVTTRACGRDSQYDFIVTEILRCHFEIEHAVRTQIHIIESAWEDGDTRVRRTLPHIVVTFRQMDIEFDRHANSKARLSPDHSFVRETPTGSRLAGLAFPLTVAGTLMFSISHIHCPTGWVQTSL